jgi:adenylate cyclase
VHQISTSELELLRHSAAVLAAGLPLIAFLQLVRVHGQALAQIADAEVRLFHMYVHEPLMRTGVPGVQMAEEMQGLAAEVLPLASPMMDHVHQRLLAHFIDQDVVGHMEADLDQGERLDLGHLRVAIAFADLAGYTRMTEELGDEHAVDIVEHFIAEVEHTLPEDARIIKTIGDEVMVVATDPAALVDWAVGFQQLHRTRPLPRIGMHYGTVLYRDGDYYGREVNQAARVSARSGAGEVLVTRPVVEAAGGHLEFERIGEVRLKGFSEATELFVASSAAQSAI